MSDLPLDVALQLCQVLRITLVDLRLQVPPWKEVERGHIGRVSGPWMTRPPADDAADEVPLQPYAGQSAWTLVGLLHLAEPPAALIVATTGSTALPNEHV